MSLYPARMVIQRQPHHYNMRSYALDDAVKQWEQHSTIYEDERSGVANGPETLMTEEQANRYIDRYESTQLDDGQSIVIRVCRSEDDEISFHTISVDLSEEELAALAASRNNATRYFNLAWSHDALLRVEHALTQELLQHGYSDSELISYTLTSSDPSNLAASFKVRVSRPKPNAVHDRYVTAFLYHS